MDMMAIGSLSSYVKQAGLRAKVDLKKQSGTLQSHTDPTAMPARKTVEASMYQQQIDDERENKDGDSGKLEQIMNKVYAGKKLTVEEREYLKAKDPESYQRLQSIESDQKSYERELKRCRTKEEAQRLKMQHLNSALSRVKSVENNANIPKERKLIIVRMEQMHMEKIDKTLKAFVRSGKYDKLPTEAEEAEAEKEVKEAREAEQAVGTGKADERAAEAPDGKEAGEAQEAPKAAEEKSGVETPEERKTRQARQRAAFAPAWGGEEPEAPVIDVEA